MSFECFRKTTIIFKSIHIPLVSESSMSLKSIGPACRCTPHREIGPVPSRSLNFVGLLKPSSRWRHSFCPTLKETMEQVVCLPESSSVVTSTKFRSPFLAAGPRQADVTCNLCSTSSSVSIGFQEYSVLPFKRVHP